MNPLDLSGPQFLLFYSIFGVLVVAVLWLLRRTAEAGMPIPSGLTDPYLIAFLRGGRKEAVNVAVLSLIDAGFLRLEDEQLATSQTAAAAQTRRPLENAILACFRTPRREGVLLEDPAVAAALSEYDAALRNMGALPGPETARTRLVLYLPALALLLGLAISKIVVAFGRGRHNVGFLVVLAAGLVVIAFIVAFPLRTVRGDALLADLRTLFSPLRHRVGKLRHGLGANEFAFFAGAFGLPLASGPVASAYRAFRRRESRGSSCGASSAASCGSGCGGGGCGGGCGGCGGG